MLEYMQNGYGQQNYALHEESYAYEEGWGSEDEHHGHGHHDGAQAQAQMMCYPIKEHGHGHGHGHGHAPKLNKHQSMSHGSETEYRDTDYGWKAEKQHHDHGYGREKLHNGAAGWNGPYTSSGGYSMPTNGRMGAKVSNFQGPTPMGGKPSMYGAKYPANTMMEGSEHEVHYQVNNAPSHMKPQGLKYHDGARTSGYRHGYDDWAWVSERRVGGQGTVEGTFPAGDWKYYIVQ